MFALVVASYASVWKAEPRCLQEARRNWEIRHTLNSAVQRLVTRLPSNAIFLMDLGEHVGVMEEAGIPLRRVVNSENHRPWKRPTDPEGLWERALADPSRYVDFVIAFDGDAVDRGSNCPESIALTLLRRPRGKRRMAVIESAPKPERCYEPISSIHPTAAE